MQNSLNAIIHTQFTQPFKLLFLHWLSPPKKEVMCFFIELKWPSRSLNCWRSLALLELVRTKTRFIFEGVVTPVFSRKRWTEVPLPLWSWSQEKRQTSTATGCMKTQTKITQRKTLLWTPPDFSHEFLHVDAKLITLFLNSIFVPKIRFRILLNFEFPRQKIDVDLNFRGKNSIFAPKTCFLLHISPSKNELLAPKVKYSIFLKVLRKWIFGLFWPI